MRPPELDVTLRLYQLDCAATEDSNGDEPYMWVLGFKVDADTMVDLPASLIPELGVKVFEGMPAFPFVKGSTMFANENPPVPVPGALGTRWMRLKPALLKTGDWFPGIAGIVCLLWDQDNFDVATSEAGHKKFNALFGPALSTQLNGLINGDFDRELSMDAGGNPTGNPDESRTIAWRLLRLRDSVGRKHAVKAITKRVKDEIFDRVRAAIVDEADVIELLDRDDALGVDAQIYLGDELATPASFSLRFTDDEADYTARGNAFSTVVHRARLDSVVTKLQRDFDRDKGVWRSVCWFGTKLYWISAYRQQTTTRFDLRTLVGDAPVSVRWLLDDALLDNGSGTVPVNFQAVGKYAGPPQDALASFYPGGPGTLTYVAAGQSLEISNTDGNGVYFGKVRALYAYADDPSLFSPGMNTEDIVKRGYVHEAELSIQAVKLEMNDEYREDVRQCMRTAASIDLRQIELDFEKMIEEIGNPPPLARDLQSRAQSAAVVANTVVFDVEAPSDLMRRIISRAGGD